MHTNISSADLKEGDCLSDLSLAGRDILKEFMEQ
jgi:hypothetical protein